MRRRETGKVRGRKGERGDPGELKGQPECTEGKKEKDELIFSLLFVIPRILTR